jgi:hypothetical protein
MILPLHTEQSSGCFARHSAIQHTARYTELSQERFKDFWRQL